MFLSAYLNKTRGVAESGHERSLKGLQSLELIQNAPPHTHTSLAAQFAVHSVDALLGGTEPLQKGAKSERAWIRGTCSRDRCFP